MTSTTTPSPTPIDRAATVAQIVARHSETAAVFQRHRIDFCCRGNVTVPEACAARREDAEALFSELEQAVRGRAGERAPEGPLSLPTAALVERIVGRHHRYLWQALPRIAPLLAKVAAVHGPHNAKLPPLRDAFGELAELLQPHLEFEEEVLFPGLLDPEGPSASARAHLDDMAREHLEVGAKLARLRELSDDFTTPAWGCGSYRALMAELQELEGDVLQHVHLENHVLLPRFARGDAVLS